MYLCYWFCWLLYGLVYFVWICFGGWLLVVGFGLSERVSVSVVLFVAGLVLLLFGCFIKFAVLFVVLIGCVLIVGLWTCWFIVVCDYGLCFVLFVALLLYVILGFGVWGFGRFCCFACWLAWCVYLGCRLLVLAVLLRFVLVLFG